MAQDRASSGPSLQARAEIDKYLTAYAKDPKSRAFAALAEAYRRAGMPDEAIKVAEEGLLVHPNLPSALVTLGRAYLQKKELGKARLLLERVVEQSPDNLLAQRALGELYFQSGEVQLARQAFQALLRANPADPEAHARLKELGAQVRPASSGIFPPAQSPAPAPSAPLPPASDAQPIPPLGARVTSPASSAPPAPPQPPLAVQAPPTQTLGARVPPPAQSSAPPVSEQKKMDLFFESVDTSQSSPAPPASEYQVRPAAEIFADLEEEKRRSPITTETLGRLLLKQGYADKARVIFEGILAADPSRQDLFQQVTALRQQLALPPLQPPGPQAPPTTSSSGSRVPPIQTLGARVTPPAHSAQPAPADLSAAQAKTAPAKTQTWNIPEEPPPAPKPTPAPKPAPPKAPVPSGAPPAPAPTSKVPAPPIKPPGPQVSPIPSFGARVTSPAQTSKTAPPAPPKVIAAPPPPPASPAKAEKAEKVEALKEILERIKKGKQP